MTKHSITSAQRISIIVAGRLSFDIASCFALKNKMQSNFNSGRLTSENCLAGFEILPHEAIFTSYPNNLKEYKNIMRKTFNYDILYNNENRQIRSAVTDIMSTNLLRSFFEDHNIHYRQLNSWTAKSETQKVDPVVIHLDNIINNIKKLTLTSLDPSKPKLAVIISSIGMVPAITAQCLRHFNNKNSMAIVTPVALSSDQCANEIDLDYESVLNFIEGSIGSTTKKILAKSANERSSKSIIKAVEDLIHIKTENENFCDHNFDKIVDKSIAFLSAPTPSPLKIKRNEALKSKDQQAEVPIMSNG